MGFIAAIPKIGNNPVSTAIFGVLAVPNYGLQGPARVAAGRPERALVIWQRRQKSLRANCPTTPGRLITPPVSCQAKPLLQYQDTCAAVTRTSLVRPAARDGKRATVRIARC